VAQEFLSSPANDKPIQSLRLLEIALENGFGAVAKSILRSGIVDGLEIAPKMLEAVRRLDDSEVWQLIGLGPHIDTSLYWAMLE
jgi:hypothetical protein